MVFEESMAEDIPIHTRRPKGNRKASRSNEESPSSAYSHSQVECIGLCITYRHIRSYVDFLIISYLFFEYDFPMPRIAAGEDFLSIILVRYGVVKLYIC